VPGLVGGAEEDGHLVLEVADVMGGMLTFVFNSLRIFRHVTVFRLRGMVLVIVFDRHGRHRDQRQHEQPNPRHAKTTHGPLLSKIPIDTDYDTVANDGSG
jgi:hypothetical protein